MHIHAQSMNLNAVSLHSAAAAEKTAATQRAADVRRKLKAGALRLEAESDTEDDLRIGQWSNDDSRQRQEYYGPNSKKSSREEQPAVPFSFYV